MTTVQNIIDRALRPMRDAAQDYFDDAELIEYVNEALEDLVSRQRLVHGEATIVAASGVLALTADMLQVRWVVNPDGIEASWMDPSTFKAYVEDVPDLSASTPIAAMWEEAVHIHPAPDDGESWTVGTFDLPTAMTAVGNTIPVSRVWEKKLVNYLRSRCYTRLGEEMLASTEMGLYEMGLRPAERAFDRNMPGTITLAREPGVFDLDPEAIHLGR